MEKVRAIDVDKYDITYHILEFTCPNCGITEKVHLPEDELLLSKNIVCYDCRYVYHVEY